MTELLTAVRPADRLADYPSIVDLHEGLALRRVQDQTRLWFDANELVGFASVDPYNNLWFEFDSQTAYPDLVSEIVAWGVACVRGAIRDGDEPKTLDASCREDDSERIALLVRHGFVERKLRTLQMIRSLDEPIAAPQVPAGFHVRPVAGEQEVDALVALHRAAFGTEKMTPQLRLAMMRVPEYDPELDLLITAPDGRLAAYCMCSFSQQQNERTGRKEGYTDPVATHPEFRRRGLARALLLTGLQKLKQRGLDAAVLHTSSHNVAMQKTAWAVGYRVRSTRLWFARPVP